MSFGGGGGGGGGGDIKYVHFKKNFNILGAERHSPQHLGSPLTLTIFHYCNSLQTITTRSLQS
jgi:hypothetical protein